MRVLTSSDGKLNLEAAEFYRRSLRILEQSGIPYLVGGAYALARYTGIIRHTKDFDVFVRPVDAQRALDALAQAGYPGEMTFPHWLGKAFWNDYFIDIIFSAGNGVAEVDDLWFQHGVDEEVLDLPVKLIPPEEMIWSKGFVMERERSDVHDIMHLIHARAEDLDWQRLLQRFGAYWRVLLSYLVLFGFVYPGERDRIPAWVLDELLARLTRERDTPAAHLKLCQGTLLSRQQYLMDIEDWGYKDARLMPRGNMTPEEIEIWTADIEEKKEE